VYDVWFFPLLNEKAELLPVAPKKKSLGEFDPSQLNRGVDACEQI
jgi:hypothetical protein